MENEILNKKASISSLYREKTLNGLLESQNFVELCKSPRQKFTDDLFPPTDSSLYSGKTEFSAELDAMSRLSSLSSKSKFWSSYKAKSKYIWLRLSEVCKQGEINILKMPKEIRDNPDILTEDVIQGELGDCYFLSAISALAENPERIKILFPSLNISSAGVFVAKVYLHGHPTEIVVDDYFPFIDSPKPQLAFTGVNKKTKNIWPMILEKVWAKMNLSYEDIIAGNSAEAFEFLTPAPIETYYHDVHSDVLYQIMKQADEKDFIICSDITVTENTNIHYLAKIGLISNHAYTVIDLAEVIDPHKGIQVRLLKIRNPWGTNEWVGDWSDKSPKWTPELIEQVNYKDEDNGTFWISYEDFCKFYTSTHICMVKNNYSLCYEKYNYDKNEAFNLVQIDVPKDSSGYFIVNQRNARIYRNAKGLDEFENKYCSMIVFKELPNGDFVYIGGDCGRHNRLYVECENMLRGKYYIAVSFPIQHSDKVIDFVKLKSQTSIQEDNFIYRIGVYSPFSKLDIVDVQGEEEKKKTSDFIKDVVFDLALNNKENFYNFTEEGEKDSWRSISFEKEAGAYGYIAYENNSDALIKEHLTFNELHNINMIPIEEVVGNEVTFDEGLIEDPQLRETITRLRREFNFKSSVKISNIPKEVSQKTPVNVEVSVAPHSRLIILLEKTEEDSSVDMNSRIALVYPNYALLDEGKFPPKKTKIKYNENFVDIYECVIEHSSGVIFVYKNKTDNLKFTCTTIFPEFLNLQISVRPEDNIKQEENDYASVDPTKPDLQIKNPKNQVILSLEPGQMNFFELRSNDYFESYSYSCEMNYQMNLSRNRIKQKYAMK